MYTSANLPACCNSAAVSASLARSNAVFDSLFVMSVSAPDIINNKDDKTRLTAIFQDNLG